MLHQHLGIVHRVDVVSAQHQNIFRGVAVNDVDILVERVGRSPVPFLAHALLRRYDLHELADFGAHEAPRLL